jgi:hypothetical protein
MLESATTLAPVSGESWGAYLFFIVVLIGAQMTPYEVLLLVRSRREPLAAKDLVEMRVNVIIGFPLGACSPSRSRRWRSSSSSSAASR